MTVIKWQAERIESVVKDRKGNEKLKPFAYIGKQGADISN